MTEPDTSVTVREALLAAQARVVELTGALRDAQEHRKMVVSRATLQGVTLRQIGALLGVSGQAVHQWIGTPDRAGALDRPLEEAK